MKIWLSLHHKKITFFLPAILLWIACAINRFQHQDFGSATLVLCYLTPFLFIPASILLLAILKKWPSKFIHYHNHVQFISALAPFVVFSQNSYFVYIFALVISYLILFVFVTDKKIDFGNEKSKWWQVAVTVLSIGFVLLMVHSAWMGDDGYITLRSVDNFVNGYGLRWNVSERVQPFTHPLWTLLLSIFVFFTRDVYYTTLAVSVALSLASIYLLLRNEGAFSLKSVVTLCVLLSSAAFIHYCTSGLENPLSFFTAALFFSVWFNPQQKHRYFLLVFIAALSATNRHDTLLIYFPCLLFEFFSPFRFKKIWVSLLGISPFVIWTGFSLLYYGFPFPNTAYAKLSTGIPKQDLYHQGFLYFVDSIMYDPITLGFVLFTLIFALASKKGKLFIPTIGIAFYLIYIVRIGGDFMSGSFFSVPFFVSAFIFTEIEVKRQYIFYPIIGIAVLACIINPRASLRIYTHGEIKSTGITDERAFYRQDTGIFYYDERYQNNYWFDDGRRYKSDPNAETVQVRGNIGFLGYTAGPRFHFIDFLSDPLLARIPLDKDYKWRIGHYYRSIPAGYEETIKTGVNQIEDKDLALYYDKLKILTQDDIWSWERMKEIFRFNTGQYDHLIKKVEVNPR